MCGICGFIGQGDYDELLRMNRMLQHRGPDAEGCWHESQHGIYLAHRRLAIIDLETGDQPMHSCDGRYIISYNGEVYNHLELREELIKKGYIFKTDHSDTEVLLNGYAEWGMALPGKLNGMWAFAIYDRKKKQLFLSRDRFGQKPLFYSLQHKTFAFASELNALGALSSIKTNVSKRSLKKYFAYGYVPAPNSLFDSIYKLPAGYCLIFDAGRFDYKLTKYWEFVIEPAEVLPENSLAEWGSQLRYLLAQSVKRRLMADVPFGIFLSGGIDSSAITAFAVRQSREKIKTFSIGFQEASFDEATYAFQVADKFNTDHFSATLSMEHSRHLLTEIIGKLDEPMGDSSILPTYLLCREARKKVVVALGGDGADELFAGYDPFHVLKIAEWYHRLTPTPVHKGIRLLMARMPVSHQMMSLDFKIKRTLRGLSYPRKLWNSVWLGPLEPKELNELFDEPTDIEDLYSEAIYHWDNCRCENIVDKTLQFYTKLYLQDDILVKTDRASMMHSLEARAPFLDIDLVNFVRKIPWQFKYHKGTTKYLLKKALEPILPLNILHRPKKGFAVPVGDWLKQNLLSFQLQSDKRTLLNPTFIKKKIIEHQSNKADHRAFLWNQWLLDNLEKL